MSRKHNGYALCIEKALLIGVAAVANKMVLFVTKNVEVLGWVRNLVRIASALVLFTLTLAE